MRKAKHLYTSDRGHFPTVMMIFMMIMMMTMMRMIERWWLMTWYDDMIWYDDMMIWYDDMIWWYGLIIVFWYQESKPNQWFHKSRRTPNNIFLHIEAFNLAILKQVPQLSSKDWGMAQSRGRVYMVLVQKQLASAHKLKYVFEHVLRGKILPAFQKGGRGTVSQARAYVERVLKGMEWSRTLPADSKDCWLVAGCPVWLWGFLPIQPHSNLLHFLFLRWPAMCSLCFGIAQSGPERFRTLSKWPRTISKQSRTSSFLLTFWFALPFDRTVGDPLWWWMLRRRHSRLWNWVRVTVPLCTPPCTSFRGSTWIRGRKRLWTWTWAPCGWLGLDWTCYSLTCCSTLQDLDSTCISRRGGDSRDRDKARSDSPYIQ